MLHSVSHQTSLVFELFFGETERDGVLYFERVLPVEVLEQCCFIPFRYAISSHKNSRDRERGEIGVLHERTHASFTLDTQRSFVLFPPLNICYQQGKSGEGREAERHTEAN